MKKIVAVLFLLLLVGCVQHSTINTFEMKPVVQQVSQADEVKK